MYYTKKDLANALMIIGISFMIGGTMLLHTTMLGLIPCKIGGIMFGFGAGLKK